MSKLNFRGKTKNRGQSMVEFVLALPILLFVIFGIIEFGRLTFAWMSVQNAARFGIRYAVTGEFNEVYCVAAGNNLGAAHINADVFGGDPQDCIVPDAYTGVDSNDKERDLIDLARLFSIQDAATGGGSGLWLEPGVSGDYEQYLSTNNPIFIGQTASEGYFHTTICSNRSNQFAVDYNNHAIPLCVDNLNAVLMDDAGGPGDRVKVHIEHEHPFFLPILSNIWPSVSINAERDGIVEKFRTSRVIGVSGPILSAPTWTQTPTITDTPTITFTPTPMDTSTASPTPTITPTPDCSKYSLGNFSFLRWAQLRAIVTNNDIVNAQMTSIELIWDYAEQYGAANGYNNLNVDWFKWGGAYLPGHGQSGTRDYASSTVWNGSVPFNAGLTYRWDIDFDGDWGAGGILTGVQNSDFGVVVKFDNGCQLVQNVVPRVVITWTPVPTPTITDTPTITQTPSDTPTPTITYTPSSTSEPTLTFTPSNTPTATSTFTPSWTPSITPTPSDTPVPSHTSWPSWTPFPSSTSPPTSTKTPKPTSTYTPIFTSTQTPIPTWTPACGYDHPDFPCQPTWTPTP